jgi:hypothetical protein
MNYLTQYILDLNVCNLINKYAILTIKDALITIKNNLTGYTLNYIFLYITCEKEFIIIKITYKVTRRIIVEKCCEFILEEFIITNKEKYSKQFNTKLMLSKKDVKINRISLLENNNDVYFVNQDFVKLADKLVKYIQKYKIIKYSLVTLFSKPALTYIFSIDINFLLKKLYSKHIITPVYINSTEIIPKYIRIDDYEKCSYEVIQQFIVKQKNQGRNFVASKYYSS